MIKNTNKKNNEANNQDIIYTTENRNMDKVDVKSHVKYTWLYNYSLPDHIMVFWDSKIADNNVK
jgi:hypothetical protein